MSLHTLIVAAGSGSRFGGDIKQLSLINGETILQRAVRFADVITPNKTTVVLGFQHEALKLFVKKAKVVVNHRWAEGMGSSIAYGVASLPPSATAVLVMLCDQVALTLEHYTFLVNKFGVLIQENQSNIAPILCAEYANSLGVPAIFPRYYFDQLCDLKGDVGAKKILQTNPVFSVPLESAAIDIDTQENLAFFLAKQI